MSGVDSFDGYREQHFRNELLAGRRPHLVENEQSLITTNERREKALAGMEVIIRRMTRVAPRGDLVLADYSERELAAVLLAYLEGRPTVVEI